MLKFSFPRCKILPTKLAINPYFKNIVTKELEFSGKRTGAYTGIVNQDMVAFRLIFSAQTSTTLRLSLKIT